MTNILKGLKLASSPLKLKSPSIIRCSVFESSKIADNIFISGKIGLNLGIA